MLIATFYSAALDRVMEPLPLTEHIGSSSKALVDLSQALRPTTLLYGRPYPLGYEPSWA